MAVPRDEISNAVIRSFSQYAFPAQEKKPSSSNLVIPISANTNRPQIEAGIVVPSHDSTELCIGYDGFAYGWTDNLCRRFPCNATLGFFGISLSRQHSPTLIGVCQIFIPDKLQPLNARCNSSKVGLIVSFMFCHAISLAFSFHKGLFI